MSNSWQHYSVLNRARVRWKVISVRFIDSDVLLDLVKMGYGVLSCKSTPVDQVWLEKAVSFRNKLEKKRVVFQIKNWKVLLTAPYFGGKIVPGVIDASEFGVSLAVGERRLERSQF